MMKPTKYIHIRHLNYWWGVYNIGKFKSEDVSAAEFSLFNDPAGEKFYFHFDFYTLPALENMLAENEFMGADSSEYPCFLEKYRKLQNGELDYFVGALYYEDYHPTIKDCELGEGSLFNKKSPNNSPYYAVVFLNENQPLLPELLVKWLERLSTSFFSENFDFALANAPSKEEANNEYKDEQGVED